MAHANALSRATNILVVEGNPFELDLALLRNRDSDISKLREKLEKQEDGFFEMRNGLVYRKQGGNLLFYVPRSMEKNVMYRYHDEMGHLDIEKTTNTIEQHYWFPKLKQQVISHIKNCLKCISYTPPSGKIEGSLHSIPKGNVPFNNIHIDHFGPIDKQKNFKKYVFLVVNAFTKYVKLYATKTTSTKEAIVCLDVYFSHYNRPNLIVSDRGSAFTSKDFQDFLNSNNVRHAKVATASPQSNGQVERINRALGPMLAKLTENKPGKRWYDILENAEHAINNTISKSTGETSCKLLFGIDQRGNVPDNLKELLSAEAYRDLLSLAACQRKAEEKTVKIQTYNKTYFDRKHKAPSE
ncbi:Pro-Pol polyprotein [Anthophora quadrimaculata]